MYILLKRKSLCRRKIVNIKSWLPNKPKHFLTLQSLNMYTYIDLIYKDGQKMDKYIGYCISRMI